MVRIFEVDTAFDARNINKFFILFLANYFNILQPIQNFLDSLLNSFLFVVHLIFDFFDGASRVASFSLMKLLTEFCEFIIDFFLIDGNSIEIFEPSK